MSRHLSLKSFLSLQFLLVSLIPIIIVVVLAGIFLFPHLSKQELLEQEVLAKAITARIEGQLESSKRELRHLASVLYFIDNKIEIQELLDNVAEINPFYEAIYITDSKGIVIQVGLPDTFRALKNNFVGLDMSRKQFFVTHLKSNQQNLSNTFLSAVSGRLSVGYIISMGDNILIAEISIDKLPKLSQFLSEDSQQTIMILDGSGQLLAHPNGELNGQQLNLSRLPIVKEGLKADSASGAYSFLGVEQFGSLVHAEKSGWMVVVSQTLASYRSTLMTSGFILLAALLIGMLVAIIAASVVGGLFSRRFEVYTRQAEAITSGNYNQQPIHSSIKEIDLLGREIWNAGQQIKARELELIAKEQRYRALVEQSPVAVIEWDEDLKITGWNRVAQNILGFLDKDEIGSVVGFMAQEENQNQLAALAARFEVESIFIDENKFKSEIGDDIFCRSFNATISGDDGQLLGYLSLVEDITEQRRIEQKINELNTELEQRVTERTNDLSNTNEHLKVALKNLKRTQSELIRADKLAALGAMVAGVSHELNTPVGNALMAITTMADQTRRFEAQYSAGTVKRSMFEAYLSASRESEELISKNINRAAELITGFKQVAVDQTSSQKRKFELKQHLEEVLLTLKPLIKKTSVKISDNIPEDIQLNSFPGPLGQVITNLISNALLHGVEGNADGIIAISAEKLGENAVRIVVEDNGKGIPQENIDKVFDPFFSTRLGDGGTGLGLHIVHNIVTGVLGGTISLRSTDGSSSSVDSSSSIGSKSNTGSGEGESGTQFTIEIPLTV